MRKYGLRGMSLPDQRDLSYCYAAKFPLYAQVPPVAYLINPPVADQGGLGACVFFASLYALEAMQIARDEVPMNPSQLFAYYRYCELYGRVGQDDGAFIREGLKVLADTGVCLEETWPYTITNFPKQPPAAAYSEASLHRIVSYHALYSLDDMLNCIAAGYGFVGGITCYASIESPEVDRTGIIPMPGPAEKVLGGHAIYVCGYDLHKRAFQLQTPGGVAGVKMAGAG